MPRARKTTRVGAMMFGVTTAFWLLAMGSAMAGQCNDPWVTQAVTKYLHRPPASPSAPECNINLYRNGHWNNYGELDAAVDAYWSTHAYPGAAPAAAAGQCRDPWVTKAVQQVTGRAANGSGESGECNIRRYGGGQWSSYDDLVGKVRIAFGGAPPPINIAPQRSDFQNLVASAPRINALPSKWVNGKQVYEYQGRWYQTSQVISQGGGNIVSHDSGTLITSDGASLHVLKLITDNGGGVVGPGGAIMQQRR